MKGVILQPGYLPWMGFFDLMAKADIFVIYDDIQYTRRDWRNRNRIKLNNQIQILSVPIQKTETRKDLKINQALIDNSSNWQRKHVETIRHAYTKTKYFSRYSPELFKILSKKYMRLIELLIPIILWSANELQVKTRIDFSSKLNISEELKKSDRLIAICKKLGINNYLTGDAAKNYISIDQFKNNNINVQFHNYKHPVYEQLGTGFISHLSIIDLIFNCGAQSKNFFKNKLTIL